MTSWKPEDRALAATIKDYFGPGTDFEAREEKLELERLEAMDGLESLFVDIRSTLLVGGGQQDVIDCVD